MYKRVRLIVVSLVLIGCMPRDIYSESSRYVEVETNLEHTCTNMINLFNKTDYLSSAFAQKGYETQARYAFVTERELRFMNVLENLHVVNFKYIDKKCYELNKILSKNNPNVQAVDLKRFKETVNSQYRLKLKEQSIKKLQINFVDGCQNFAHIYFRSLININRDNINLSSTSKRQYERCVHTQEKILNGRR